ncbi:kinesin light chain 4-like isoform X2 [Octopus vulgaris]|uniref:Kinesin light chain 4-like isoform X2 n=1 Tax=Octopus vulgaris TaxID=6645 RepID=A0AA36BWH6_OCTVU|nr:kinesin light chain 4-like isoform X2 [Octopus vulgaris]
MNLIGRESEKTFLRNFLKSKHRLLQVYGQPSVGKTRLVTEVAVEARSIINLCYPEAATEFFKAILDASKKLGTEKQKALLMVSYGHSLQSRNSLAVKEAQWHFKSALRILQNYGCDYQCLLIYNYMSLNYYRQGKLEKGIRAAEKALETTVFDRDRADVEHAKIYSYVHLTHNLIFAGNHSKAGQVLHEQLTLVGESGHPAVCYMLNNVGLNIERSGGLPNLALQFYLSSLFSKRSISCVQEHILVPTLCNVAGQFSKNKLRHDLALNFLHEAKEIRARTGWVHPYTALVMWNIGMVTMRKNVKNT